MAEQELGRGDVWFAYDGECPICSYAAHALRIRQAVGALYLVDARSEPDHPLIRKIAEHKLDLDEGMVIRFGDRLYHGVEALHMIALLGSEQGWYNRMNAWLFRSPRLARLAYPFMRGTRNLLIRLRGVAPINNLGQK